MHLQGYRNLCEKPFPTGGFNVIDLGFLVFAVFILPVPLPDEAVLLLRPGEKRHGHEQ